MYLHFSWEALLMTIPMVFKGQIEYMPSFITDISHILGSFSFQVYILITTQPQIWCWSVVVPVHRVMPPCCVSSSKDSISRELFEPLRFRTNIQFQDYLVLCCLSLLCRKLSYMFLLNGVSTSSIAVKAEILLPSTALLSNCRNHHMARQLEGGQVKVI